MGRIRVDPDTQAAAVPGLFAAGEAARGMHKTNRLGSNSLSDLLVFGLRAGHYAAEHAASVGAEPVVDPAQVEAAERGPGPGRAGRKENPYTVQQAVPDTMQDLVGIIRTEGELKSAWWIAASRSGRPGSGSRATASTIRAGTWPWTCARC